MDETVPLVGRPHGGTCILWKSSLKNRIDIINCVSNRLSAILLYINENCNILLFNTYMPCDDRHEGRNLDVYRAVLDEIMSFVQQINPTYYIVGGDLNTDLTRNSPQSDALNTFLSSECLSCPALNERFAHLVDYTYSNSDGTITSTIDHIMVSNSLFDFITLYETICSIDNLSDHVALVCNLSIPLEYCSYHLRNLLDMLVGKRPTKVT